ncbi:hypothetical protein ACI6Q2_19645 [Chitinophagaceae bacterium LWZ2-11]
MALLKYFFRLQYMDFLIRRKATGDLKTFAVKNRLSKRNLIYVIKEMKEMGFPIKYDKNRKSYYYEKEGQMVSKLFVEKGQVLSRNELQNMAMLDVKNLCFSEVAIFEPCENW